MTEQEQRHAATMDFLKSGKELAEEIAKEIRRIDAQERREIEREWRSRCVKPVVNEDE